MGLRWEIEELEIKIQALGLRMQGFSSGLAYLSPNFLKGRTLLHGTYVLSLTKAHARCVCRIKHGSIGLRTMTSIANSDLYCYARSQPYLFCQAGGPLDTRLALQLQVSWPGAPYPLPVAMLGPACMMGDGGG